MYNWSVDEEKLKKYPEKYAVWKLEQLINYGLGEEKIDEGQLRKYFKKLDIDGDKRKYLKFLLDKRG